MSQQHPAHSDMFHPLNDSMIGNDAYANLS